MNNADYNFLIVGITISFLEPVAELDRNTLAVEFAWIAGIVHIVSGVREAAECLKFEFLICISDRNRDSLISFYYHTATCGDVSIESIIVCDEVAEFEVNEWREFTFRECSTEVSKERNTHL